MRWCRFWPLLGMAITAVAASPAMACGESLFRIGKGVTYRVYSAPIPGNVLFFARNDEERAVADRLREAGHHVLTVDNDQDLQLEMREHEVDVVVAPVAMQGLLAVDSVPPGSVPDWVPVFDPDSDLPRSTLAELPRGVKADDDYRKYLKAIHKNLKD